MPALVLFAMIPGWASAQRTNPPPDPLLNERITPPVNVAAAGDLSSCLVVNVNAQPRTVHTQLMRFDGRISEDFGNITLQPGTSYGAGNSAGDYYYCKFTVIDGTRADIRGSLSVCTNTVCKQTISAE